MNESVLNKRRELLRAWSGGAAVAGLMGLGLGSMPASNAVASSTRLPGLRPLYQQKKASKSPPQPSLAASPVPDQDVRTLRRLTFGFREQDQAEFLALDPDFDTRLQLWVDAQLNGFSPAYPPTAGTDPPLHAVISDPATNFETLSDSLATLWQERVVAEPPWPEYVYPVIETQYLALIRAVYSQWQLGEVLADFWHSHFSVDGLKFEVSPVFVHYDRDVIRPHMLGNFREMLEAVTKSTAMMYYLDNAWNSRYGPNENYARELQELHTLGAVHSFGFTAEEDIPGAVAMAGSSTVMPAGLKAGYSEADVRQVAYCLTGWTISNRYTDQANTGEYIYHAPWHQPGAKRVLGIDIADSGEDETQTVLDLLAIHPNTARYVCRKLCRRLIADDPPESIVEAAAVVFNDQWQAPDQLKQVVRTILLSPEFKDASNWGTKAKRPFEIAAGAMRSCGGADEKLVRPDPFGDWRANLLKGQNYKFSAELYYRLSETGHMPFTWGTPDGFPDVRPAWLGSTPLVMSWRLLNMLFLDWIPDDLSRPSGNWHEYFPIDAVSKSKARFSAAERTANNLVDYWVRQFLGYDADAPETPQLNDAIRDQLVAFMQQDAATADTPLDLDANGWSNLPWSAYVPQRLQTLVASITMLPENLLR